jgi:glutathione peroxidase-family protein
MSPALDATNARVTLFLTAAEGNFWNFGENDIDGKPIDFASYKGKVCFVNCSAKSTLRMRSEYRQYHTLRLV